MFISHAFKVNQIFPTIEKLPSFVCLCYYFFVQMKQNNCLIKTNQINNYKFIYSISQKINVYVPYLVWRLSLCWGFCFVLAFVLFLWPLDKEWEIFEFIEKLCRVEDPMWILKYLSLALYLYTHNVLLPLVDGVYGRLAVKQRVWMKWNAPVLVCWDDEGSRDMIPIIKD